MKKIVFVIAFAIIGIGLFAANYCEGYVHTVSGDPLEGIPVGVYFWTQYGWLEIDYDCTNVDGWVQLCLSGELRSTTIMKVEVFWDGGPNPKQYFYDWDGGDIEFDLALIGYIEP